MYGYESLRNSKFLTLCLCSGLCPGERSPVCVCRAPPRATTAPSCGSDRESRWSPWQTCQNHPSKGKGGLTHWVCKCLPRIFSSAQCPPYKIHTYIYIFSWCSKTCEILSAYLWAAHVIKPWTYPECFQWMYFRSTNEIKNLQYLPRTSEPREMLFEDRTRAHADHIGQGFERQTTAAVGVLKAVRCGEEWVHRHLFLNFTHSFA